LLWEYPPPHCHPVFDLEINEGAQKISGWREEGRRRGVKGRRGRRMDERRTDGWTEGYT